MRDMTETKPNESAVDVLVIGAGPTGLACAIAAQNEGKGVVCASTWVMPAALVRESSALDLQPFLTPRQVPRPWDFPDPPTVNNQIITPVLMPPNTMPLVVPAVKIIPATLPRGVAVA